MPEPWVRYKLEATLLSDAHPGSGSGGGGTDALVARDRQGRPVIWASHIEGVLRDAARRLNNGRAESFFGRAGGSYASGEAKGDRQRAIFTSLYAEQNPESHVWRSTAGKSFDNRSPKDDTLRVFEYVPVGTQFRGYVELPETELPVLQRLVKEVDALGSGRSSGAGRVQLSLEPVAVQARNLGLPTNRLTLLLRNIEPLCIAATATPGNLIPTLAFIPGRTLLGSVAAWLIAEGARETAELLTSGKISISDALPLPYCPDNLRGVEVLPAPLSLQSKKPQGRGGKTPWWAEGIPATERLDSLAAGQNPQPNREKLKRPDDDLFVFRAAPDQPWVAFRPAFQVRLRNGRPEPTQPDPSLFATEQIAEETCFLAEIQGQPNELKKLVEKLQAVLAGKRWLRVGRGGSPVEVIQVCSPAATPAVNANPVAYESVLLTLTSDLLVRDENLRWCTTLDESRIRSLLGDEIGLADSVQSSVSVRGFNGTSRLWRMPATAIRRGSVFRLTGAGVVGLAARATSHEWLGERTHEGFGRFRIDAMLPGVTTQVPEPLAANANPIMTVVADHPEEVIAATTQTWFRQRKSLAKSGSGTDRRPSPAQWLDFVEHLERDEAAAINARLNPTTSGGKNWLHPEAQEILKQLRQVNQQRVLHARFFVRWLRAEMRSSRSKENV